VPLSLKSLLGLVAVATGIVVLLPAGAGAGGVPAVVVGNDYPSWSPDGQTLAYVSFRSGRVGDIFTVRPDGRGERRLTNTTVHEDMPRWSPDGSKIAFVRYAGGAAANFHIFVMNADGSGETQVTQTGSPNFAPTWSPDGSRIAFVTTRHAPGNPEIYSINVDGSGETRLTNHPARDDSPDWSPDGSQIVFESNRSPSGALRLYAMRHDGTDVRAFTNHPVEWHNEMQPKWSPDGRTVAFVTERHPPVNNAEIYLVDANGENSRRVTRNDVRDATPAWSPDGSRIALARGAALRPEVYVISARGGSARKLTGVNLSVVRLVRLTAQPRAGRFFSVELVVRPALDRYADIACYAAIGKQLLDPEVATIRRGRVHCAWFVPRSAKGKKFYGFAGALAGGTQASRTFSIRVR
jgi:TolB protein